MLLLSVSATKPQTMPLQTSLDLLSHKQVEQACMPSILATSGLKLHALHDALLSITYCRRDNMPCCTAGGTPQPLVS